MNSILLRGVIRQGRVEVDYPINLPEGTEVVVTPDASVPEEIDAAGPIEAEPILEFNWSRARSQIRPAAKAYLEKTHADY